MKELRQFLMAAGCATACWLLMAFVVTSQTVAAFIFVPLSLSTLATPLFGANFAFYVVESARSRNVKTRAPACQHYRFEPVRLLVTGELVANVCADCYTPLPADWRADDTFDALIAEIDRIDARLQKLSGVLPLELVEHRHALWNQARALWEAMQ